MSENSAIEWTHHTFNPWWGCTEVSPACDHCYAREWAKRFGVRWGTDAPRRLASSATWDAPLLWNRKAGKLGERRRVFCASMADVFDVDAPPGQRERLWHLIEATQHLDWLLLTKRVGNVLRMIPDRWRGGLPANVWLGSTVVTPLEVARDVPKLQAVPARIRFLSMEPLLEDTPMDGYLDGIHWVIVGGESGRGARAMLKQWAMHIRLDCMASGVPFFFKQGSSANWQAPKDFDSFPPGLQVREWPGSQVSISDRP